MSVKGNREGRNKSDMVLLGIDIYVLIDEHVTK